MVVIIAVEDTLVKLLHNTRYRRRPLRSLSVIALVSYRVDKVVSFYRTR